MRQLFYLTVVFVLFSCNTNKHVITYKTKSNQKIIINLPNTLKPVCIDSLSVYGSKFAEDMPQDSKENWSGYIDDKFNLFTMWNTNGIYNDVYNEKGAMEIASQGSNYLLLSKVCKLNGNVCYVSVLKGQGKYQKKIKASTYFGRNNFILLIECKEQDFPEAEKLLIKILDSIKVK